MLKEFLREDMKSKQVSVKELAQDIGISVPHLYRILKGLKAGNKTLRGVAKFYDLPIEEVVKMNDN